MEAFPSYRFDELAKRVARLEQELGLLKARDQDILRLKQQILDARAIFKAHHEEFLASEKESDRITACAIAQINQLWERVAPMFEKLFPGAENTIQQIDGILGVDVLNPPAPEPNPRKPS